MGERMADDLRLLVDLLGHEVAVVALFGEQASGGTALDAALNGLAGSVADHRARAAGHDPVAFLEIGDAVGERSERQRVRTEIGLALAVAHSERRPLARADQQVILAFEQVDESERAPHPLEAGIHGLGRGFAGREFVFDHEGGDLGIGLRLEDITFGRKLLAQCAEILDDAVVDDGEAGRGVRMGVGLGRLSMRRPAGMADAGRARQRGGCQPRLEVFQFSFGPAARKLAVFKRGDAGRVVASVFQALQRVDDGAGDRPRSKDANNSTHAKSPI